MGFATATWTAAANATKRRIKPGYPQLNGSDAADPRGSFSVMAKSARKPAPSPTDSVAPGESKPAAAMAGLLLPWYDREHRRLPWRAPPGKPAMPPYRVWLSEIMLQQTTVAAVIPYFQRFTALWPDVRALAEAPQETVLAEWAGLGYYARARNLHACAQTVLRQHGGAFPKTEAELLALPGIGTYTAAAIAAIAFDQPAAVLDGNVERVLSRVFDVQEPLPGSKPRLRALCKAATPQRRPGDFAQAMMDLGATLCAPNRPDCLLCPLSELCRGRQRGTAAELPRKAPKPERPHRHAIAFLLRRPDGALYFRRRPDKGLLGGMLEVPSTDWRDAAWTEKQALLQAPHAGAWRMLDGEAEHVFTHFSLGIRAMQADITAKQAARLNGEWLQPAEAKVPTVIKKMLKLLR